MRQILALLSLVLLISCQAKQDEGEILARQYCASCHQFPEPSLLPVNVWQYGTLPYMGMMMGIESEIQQLKAPISHYMALRGSSPMLTEAAWKQIKDYYLDQAPKKLEEQEHLTSELALVDFFDMEPIDLPKAKGLLPNVTALAIWENGQSIILGDQANQSVIRLDANGRNLQAWQNQLALSHVNLQTKIPVLSFIGSSTQANPKSQGQVLEYGKGTILFKNLRRPVYLLQANLVGDQSLEWVTCEFGLQQGALAFWTKSPHGWEKNSISTQAGAVQVMAKDVNEDHRTDLICLYAQGDESIVTYINQGDGKFRAERSLRFPPVYGSTSMDLADIDQDGDDDIIYTAGDNADFSTVWKPYHGVYIFENKGNWKFKQKQFFPQNGANKVLVRDFDGDGDLDMASISLFPNVGKRPKEGFLFFERKGKQFEIKTLNIDHVGRWCSMDAGDLDGDGDVDLVLGSLPVQEFAEGGFDPAWKTAKGILILRNKKR